MSEQLIIVNSREHYFEFDLVVEGLDDSDAKVCFNILSQPFDMCFECKRVKPGKWGVDLPKMQYLVPTTYTFTVTAVITGYYFEAHRGEITVSKSPEIYVKREDMQMRVESRAADAPKPVTEEPAPTTPVKPKAKDHVPEKRVVQRPARPGDNVTEDQVKDIISRLTSSETIIEDAKPAPAKKPVDVKPLADQDALTEARRVAKKLLAAEEKTGDSALAKTSDKDVKQIIREHKRQEAEKKKRREIQLERKNAEAKKAAPAKPVITEGAPKAASVQIDAEADARAKAVLESFKAEPAKPSTAAFKKGGKVVK
jgi:DNA polymerase III gamma/tau subunit